MTTRKAIALGLLTTAVVTLLAFGIKHKAFKTTTPNANKRLEVRAENTLTDLTNTKWYFNNTLNDKTPNGTSTTYKPLTTETESYGIRFTSNNNSYDALAFTLYSNATHNAIRYITRPIATAYNLETNTWTNSNYKKIHITSGTDVTNTKLINWLFNNATLLTINTVENTSWQLNEEITDIPTYQYDINFYCNGLYFDALRLGYQFGTINNSITYGDTSQRCYFVDGTWTYYTPYSKILITEGNGDEENTNLIVWLLNNAKQFTTFNTVLDTKWTFIEHPKSEFENLTYDVQFTSYNKPCQTIKAGYTTNNIMNQIAYGFKTSNTNPYTINTVYDGSQWNNAKWQTIIIVSGNDVENLSFISFLISNAEGISYTPIPTWNADSYDIENGNFVSLQSLMIQILTMPFTFISQAFNVTLWPNTAWEFNLSNFILGIIAIASLIFIIRLFTSGFAIIGNYTGKRDDRAFKRSQTKLNNSKADLNNRTDPNNKHITTKKE